MNSNTINKQYAMSSWKLLRYIQTKQNHFTNRVSQHPVNIKCNENVKDCFNYTTVKKRHKWFLVIQTMYVL